MQKIIIQIWKMESGREKIVVCSPLATPPLQKPLAQPSCPFHEGSRAASRLFFHCSKCHCHPLTSSTAPSIAGCWPAMNTGPSSSLTPSDSPGNVWLCWNQREGESRPDAPKWLETARPGTMDLGFQPLHQQNMSEAAVQQTGIFIRSSLPG